MNCERYFNGQIPRPTQIKAWRRHGPRQMMLRSVWRFFGGDGADGSLERREQRGRVPDPLAIAAASGAQRRLEAGNTPVAAQDADAAGGEAITVRDEARFAGPAPCKLTHSSRWTEAH